MSVWNIWCHAVKEVSDTQSTSHAEAAAAAAAAAWDAARTTVVAAMIRVSSIQPDSMHATHCDAEISSPRWLIV